MLGPRLAPLRRLWRDRHGALAASQAWGIAGVVLAAGVGGALVANAGLFEERLHRTGLDSVDDLSLGLGFGAVTGFVKTDHAGRSIAEIKIGVRAADGVDTVDLHRVVVYATDGDRLVSFAFDNGTGNQSGQAVPRFTAQSVLDDDGSAPRGFVQRGDVVDLMFPLRDAGLALDAGDALELRFISDSGPSMRVTVQGPSYLTGKNVVALEREVLRGD